MGPAALPAVVIMGRYHLVARESVLVWLSVFIGVAALGAAGDFSTRRHSGVVGRHVRVACQVLGATAVIYLTGWGPVLIGAYTFVALENIAHHGARVWKTTLGWSLFGVLAGQLTIWWGVTPSLLSDEHAQALGVLGVFVLIFVVRMAAAAAEEKEDAEAAVRASEDRFRSLVQNSSDTTLVVGRDQTVVYASPAVAGLLGQTPESVIGLTPTDLMHPDDFGHALAMVAGASGRTEPVELRLAHRDGTWREVEAVITDLRGTPSVDGFVANLRDITDRKAAESVIAYQAVHDPLTGLANRTLLLDRAEQMLFRCARTLEPCAALFLDLDDFKDVNDTLGHEAGDKLLRAIAERLTATVRSSDTVGRLGGDEFVILAEGATLAAGPELLAERLRDVLAEPFHLEGFDEHPVFVTVSIGISTRLCESAEELLRDADVALYRAKGSGKNCWTLFEPEMQSEILERLMLKMDLQTALENREFFLLYQPLFELATTYVYGVEALLRWQHPTRGVVGPDEFIPLLEESGLIVPVGRWVLNEACRQAADWRSRGHELTVSVNLSMRQLEAPTLIGDVRTALGRAGLDAQHLLLEVTETALMRDADSTIARLTNLKSLGVQIAIDDFGTGYSSLGYLRQFPVDALKIDRSFVDGIGSSPESRVLIHTMVALGRALGLETIAEGIEDLDQLERLRGEGCDRGQGFLISRPVQPNDLELLLENQVAVAVADDRPAVVSRR